MLKAVAQTPPSRNAFVVALIGVALALAAAFFLALWPCSYRTESSRVGLGPGRSGEVTETRCSSLLDVNGPGVLVLVGLPVGLALLGLAGAAAGRRAPQGAIGALLLLSVLASAIFLYFVPAGVALIVSAATVRSPRDNTS